MIDACPMKAWSALGFTPAAIIIAANEWRHSCGEIRASPAAFQASSACRCSRLAANGLLEVRPRFAAISGGIQG